MSLIPAIMAVKALAEQIPTIASEKQKTPPWPRPAMDRLIRRLRRPRKRPTVRQ